MISLPKFFTFIVLVFSFNATADYKAHFVCYGVGGGSSVGEYQLGLMELAYCHQLGWFSINKKPDVKLFINVKRSNIFALPTLFAKMDTFVMVFETTANYVDLHGRYFGRNIQWNTASIPLIPKFGPSFSIAHYSKESPEENGTNSHQQISFFGVGAGFDVPLSFQESAIEIAYL